MENKNELKDSNLEKVNAGTDINLEENGNIHISGGEISAEGYHSRQLPPEILHETELYTDR